MSKSIIKHNKKWLVDKDEDTYYVLDSFNKAIAKVDALMLDEIMKSDGRIE